MSKDEEFVRANWKRVEVCGPYVSIWPNAGEYEDVCANWHCWAAAAEFTRERLEQIRQLEEEVEEVDYMLEAALDEIWQRILTRLESALADLKRGMRTAAPDGARSNSNG